MTSHTHQDRAQPGTLTTARARWSAMAVLLLPVLLVSIDNTVLTFALPQISTALTPSGTGLLWIVDIYSLVLTGLLVPMGALADRYGRRRVLTIGCAGFAVISTLAAFAPTYHWLIAARAGLGVFGAMLMPATLSLIRNIFVDRAQRRKAIAIWAAGFSSGAAVGPLVGGVLLQHFWWGSVFLLAVPVIVVYLVLAGRTIPESADPDASGADLISSVMILAAMYCLVYGIKTQFGSHTPYAWVWCVVGAVILAGFCYRQLHIDRPMLDIRLFTLPDFSGSVLVNLISMMAVIGFLIYASQDLQLVNGLDPIHAGLWLLPGVVLMVVFGLFAVPLVARFRPATVMGWGLVASALGFVVVIVHRGSVPVWLIMTAFALISMGVGLTETISNDLIVASVPRSKAGAASAISETAYELGTVLGTAILGLVLTASYSRSIVIPDGVDPADANAASLTLGGAHEVAERLPEGLAHSLLSNAHDAFTVGVGASSQLALGLLALALVITATVLRQAR